MPNEQPPSTIERLAWQLEKLEREFSRAEIADAKHTEGHVNADVLAEQRASDRRQVAELAEEIKVMKAERASQRMLVYGAVASGVVALITTLMQTGLGG